MTRYRIEGKAHNRFAVYRETDDGEELVNELPTRGDAETYVKGEEILDRYFNRSATCESK